MNKGKAVGGRGVLSLRMVRRKKVTKIKRERRKEIGKEENTKN